LANAYEEEVQQQFQAMCLQQQGVHLCMCMHWRGRGWYERERERAQLKLHAYGGVGEVLVNNMRGAEAVHVVYNILPVVTPPQDVDGANTLGGGVDDDGLADGAASVVLDDDVTCMHAHNAHQCLPGRTATSILPCSAQGSLCSHTDDDDLLPSHEHRNVYVVTKS
jgi:hypothetical protein